MPFPCRRGDFVDCLFPFAERPETPGPMRHIGYAQSLLRLPDGRLRVLLMLTTSSPKMIARIPEGLALAISAEKSVSMGMRNAFVIDVHRLAVLPLEPAWFPDLEVDRFVLARADDALRVAVTRRYDEMLARYPNPAEIFGPPAGRKS